MNFFKVETKEMLNALQNHIEGEIAYCEKEKKYYSWQENSGWGEMTFDGQGIEMNLYDLNKSIMTNIKTVDVINYVESFIEFNNKHRNNFYMLLCKDWNYYTIFSYDRNLAMPSFDMAVIDIISNIGEIKSIENNEDNSAIEIWIKPKEEDECYAFYLFPYDAGVVYYG